MLLQDEACKLVTVLGGRTVMDCLKESGLDATSSALSHLLLYSKLQNLTFPRAWSWQRERAEASTNSTNTADATRSSSTTSATAAAALALAPPPPLASVLRHEWLWRQAVEWAGGDAAKWAGRVKIHF